MRDDLLDTVFKLLEKRGMKITTAESCTGGLLAATITTKSGASKVFERGFITYSNESKTEMLYVPEKMIETHGAVSEEVAESMACGALKNSNADLAISITGLAGPDGGTKDKPVGLVCFGYALKDGPSGAHKHIFEESKSREDVQARAATAALKYLASMLKEDA